MLTLLSLSMMTASANTETAATCAANVPAALCVTTIRRRVYAPHVSLGRVTFDGDDLQQYAMVEDDTDFRALVPGSSRGYLGGHSPGDVAIMLDGVVLLNSKRLGPMP